jgi:hypothetical protein
MNWKGWTAMNELASPPASAEKQQGNGRFQKGRSGNPAGRAAGSRNKASIMLEQLMADEGEAIVKRVIQAALTGDTAAARIILDRLCPPRRARHVSIDLPLIHTAADAANAIARVVQAVATGDLSPDEGAGVAGLIETFRKTLETQELEARIVALEKRATYQ